MNRIDLSPSNEAILIDKYRKLVYEETKSKLAFVIAVFARKQRKISDSQIQSASFNLGGTTFINNLKDGGRKIFLNILFAAKKRVPKANSIDYIKIGRKTSYKKSFSAFSIDLDSLEIIYKNLDHIITKKLTSSEINSVLIQLKGKLQSKQDKAVLDFVFNYPKYFHQTGTNKKYFGIQLSQALSTNVCVYCNREFISTITNVNGKKVISPAFDHFLSQSEYPYMAISLFNLIPSCYSCNSQLKHDEPFNLNDYLYPFDSSYEGKAEFKTYWKKSVISSEIPKAELINIHDLCIKIEPPSVPDPKIFGNLALSPNYRKGNLKVFQTELVYESIHKDCVHEIITQFRVHSKRDIESLKKSYSFIKNDSDVYQFYFKNYMDEKDFNKRPLARMTRDIAKQLDSIYKLNIFK